MITFALVRLTNLRVSLKDGEITLTAKVSLSDENYQKAEKLRPYLGADQGNVKLEISPAQLDLMTATMSVEERNVRKD